MVFDASSGDVLLFGGGNDDGVLNETWTWDGTDWTQQHPSTSPPARAQPGIAFDQARGEVVMFSGNGGGYLTDTWTWDGSTWTKEHPSTKPQGRNYTAMAYDAARGVTVLFGGNIYPNGQLNDTWTWDGTDWTQQSPPVSPSPRLAMGFVYDDTRSEALMFGGIGSEGDLNETWTWDGATWTRLSPHPSPSRRWEFAMAYDGSRGRAVVFGGWHDKTYGDTWTWNGKRWGVPLDARLSLSPNTGPPGTVVHVFGRGFAGYENVNITFIDSGLGSVPVGTIRTDASGRYSGDVMVPPDATDGVQRIVSVGGRSGQQAGAKFTVT